MKKQFLTSGLPRIVFCVLLGSLVGSNQQTDSPWPTNAPNRVFCWKVVLKAEDEPTFRDARFLLSQISMPTVSDPDLKEVIEYQENNVYNFCMPEAGVHRDAKMDIKGILASIDYKALASTLIKKLGSTGSRMRGGLKDADMLILIGVTFNKFQERDQHVHEFTLPCLRGSRL